MFSRLPGFAAALTCLFAFSVFAEDVKIRVDIPAQDLSGALTQFGREVGTEIVFTPQSVHEKNAPAVKGEFGKDEALRILLRGTGLVHRMTAQGAIVVEPPKTIADASMPELAQNSDSPVGGDAASKDADKGENTSSVAEIVVTAQKRTERLQDVPISITVLTGEYLDSATGGGVTDALRRVPGVSALISGQNGGTQLSIRGVTAANAKFSGASTVGYYLDSVPFGLVKSAVLPDANPYDLDRIEVLRGPQGTLYGANSQNGVVRILTKDPVFDEFELKARTSISTTRYGGENYRIDTAVNLPLLSDKLAARATIGYQDLSGWIDRPTRKNANDAELLNGRFKLRAQPTEQLAIGASIWAARNDYGAPSWSADNRRNPFDDGERMTTDYNIYSLTANYDLSSFSVTSSTSYMEYFASGFQDLSAGSLTGLDLETIDDSTVFTQEFNVVSTHDGPWRWSAGAIYRDADSELYQNLGPFPPAGFRFINSYVDTSKSFAVFGELTRLFMDDRLELTGGLRYFEDEVTQNELANVDGLGPLLKSAHKFDKVSPRVVLTWHQNDDMTLYASYAEGFRSGSDQGPLTLSAAPSLLPVEEDNLKNYELGGKGTFWDGRVSIESAVFYIDWADIQQPITVPIGTTAIGAVVNGETANGLGFELATTAALTRELTVGVNFGWNDLANDADVVTFPGGVPVVLFPEGSRLSSSPEYTAGISADYVFPLGGRGYGGRLSASADYTSGVYTRSLGGTTVNVVHSPTLIFGRASFSLDSPGSWTTTLYVENIGNEEDPYIGNGRGTLDVRPRPRTFGLQFELRL